MRVPKHSAPSRPAPPAIGTIHEQRFRDARNRQREEVVLSRLSLITSATIKWRGADRLLTLMLKLRLALICAIPVSAISAERMLPSIRVERLPGNPIITEKMLTGDDGGSINGPSLIRVPAWVKNPLGQYYLYFAHHAGNYLRFAHADRLEGPWTIRPGGVLQMADQKVLNGHIASPAVVVDEAERRFLLYYHGRPLTFRKKDLVGGAERDPEAGQKTAVAISSDGLAFISTETIVGPAYLQVFHHAGRWFALNQSGELLVNADPTQRFEPVARILGPDIADAIDPLKRGEPGAPKDRTASGPDRYSLRHIGTDVAGDRLIVYFSCVGHRPERILCTVVDLIGAPVTWRARGAIEVLRPETEWEGATLPPAFSKGGRSREWENSLRDPAVFRDGGDAWLVYAAAGEHGVGLARLRYSTGTR